MSGLTNKSDYDGPFIALRIYCSSDSVSKAQKIPIFRTDGSQNTKQEATRFQIASDCL